jgi:hypothetical protein
MANTAPQRYLTSQVDTRIGIWDTTITLAQANAGAVIVPNKTGYYFVPISARFKAIGGNATGPTTLVLYETGTIGTVVLSHVTADCTSGTWVGPTGGTAVATYLNVLPLATVAKGVSFGVAGGSALSVCTHVRCSVAGYWLAA